MTNKEKQEWQKYFDNKISHAIGAIEYGNYFYDKVKEFADSAKDDCEAILESYVRCGTKSKSQRIKDEIDKRLDELESDLAHFINSELPKIIETENEWLDEDVAPYLNIEFDKVRSGLTLLSAVPIAYIVSASTFPTNTVNKLRDVYDSILRQSLVTGLPFEETEEDYEPRFHTFDRQLQVEAETLGSGLPDQYDRIIFTKNDKKIHRYMWVSILDSFTCIVCGDLDGQIFDSIDKVPVYSQHPRCRCSCIVLPDNIDPEDIRETYTEWFSRQSEETQYRVLGKTRYEMYKSGMGISQFVNSGRKIPLSEMKTVSPLTETPAKANKITAKLVSEKYPNEQFVKRKITDESSLFVSKERIKAGIKDTLVYNWDKMMSTVLIKETNKDFYLIAENKVGVTNPDGFYIADTIEMKHVRGGLDKLGKNAITALKQSNNVFLYADNNFSKDACIKKIRGSVRAKRAESLQNKKIFNEPNKDSLLYIFSNGNLYKLKWEEVL